NSGWKGALQTGYETNNKQRVFGGKLNYSGKKWYVNSNLTYRKASDYKAGKSHDIQHSRYDKINMEASGGYKIAKDKSLNASLIFDQAWDVGYPGLTMDVSLARAVIANASYMQDSLFGT